MASIDDAAVDALQFGMSEHDTERFEADRRGATLPVSELTDALGECGMSGLGRQAAATLVPGRALWTPRK
jgi:hypothetical protein